MPHIFRADGRDLSPRTLFAVVGVLNEVNDSDIPVDQMGIRIVYALEVLTAVATRREEGVQSVMKAMEALEQEFDRFYATVMAAVGTTTPPTTTASADKEIITKNDDNCGSNDSNHGAVNGGGLERIADDLRRAVSEFVMTAAGRALTGVEVLEMVSVTRNHSNEIDTDVAVSDVHDDVRESVLAMLAVLKGQTRSHTATTTTTAVVTDCGNGLFFAAAAMETLYRLTLPDTYFASGTSMPCLV